MVICTNGNWTDADAVTRDADIVGIRPNNALCWLFGLTNQFTSRTEHKISVIFLTKLIL